MSKIRNILKKLPQITIHKSLKDVVEHVSKEVAEHHGMALQSLKAKRRKP